MSSSCSRIASHGQDLESGNRRPQADVINDRWLKTSVTTAVAWGFYVFGAMWLLSGGPDAARSWRDKTVFLGTFGAYLIVRTMLLAESRRATAVLTPGYFVLDTSGLAVALALTGGSQSPFAPLVFIMPVAGALIYGMRGGVVAALGMSLALLPACIASGTWNADSTTVWDLLGHTFGLLSVGLAAGIMADGERRAVRARHQAEKSAAMALAEERGSARLLARTTEIQEAERARIGHDLHDGVGPLLVAVKLRIASAQNTLRSRGIDLVEDQLTEGRAILAESVGELRRLVHDLHPAVLERQGLEGALAEMIDRFDEHSELTVSLHWSFEGDLPSAVERCLYRVSQEAVENARRHAEASIIRVSVMGDDEAIELVVEDDGIGLDAVRRLSGSDSGADCGLGLIGMRRRVLSCDGSFDVLPHATGGTTVLCRLPLSRK